MTEKKQQHKKKRGKVQHIRGSPKKRKISGKAVFSSESIPGKMLAAVGRDRLVLDLSCRRKGGAYYIVTDRWQKFTDVQVTPVLLDELSGKCSEFLIHAVDVEGKASGIETELAKMLGAWDGIPVTYAGGVGSLEDVESLRTLGKGRLDVTIGSALDLFGGCIPYRNVVYLR